MRRFFIHLALALGIAAAGACVTASALAQPPETIAALVGIEGSVLVSRGDGIAPGVDGQRLAAGMRVLTTTGAKVLVRYDTGCEVRVPENSRFTVKPVTDCAALAGEVVALGPESTAAAAEGGFIGSGGGLALGTGLAIGGAATGTTVAIGAAAVGAGVAAFEVYETSRRHRNNRNVSPN